MDIQKNKKSVHKAGFKVNESKAENALKGSSTLKAEQQVKKSLKG